MRFFNFNDSPPTEYAKNASLWLLTAALHVIMWFLMGVVIGAFLFY